MSAMAPPARVLVVAGPTAVGKSSAALKLCEARDGELVSADSVQLYRGLDVGSNKPSPAELERVRHHLVDVADASNPWSAGAWCDAAAEAIGDVARRAKMRVGYCEFNEVSHESNARRVRHASVVAVERARARARSVFVPLIAPQRVFRLSLSDADGGGGALKARAAAERRGARVCLFTGESVSPHAEQKRLAFNGWWQSGWEPTADERMDEALSDPEMRHKVTHTQLQMMSDILGDPWQNMPAERRERLSALRASLMDELQLGSGAE